MSYSFGKSTKKVKNPIRRCGSLINRFKSIENISIYRGF